MKRFFYIIVIAALSYAAGLFADHYATTNGQPFNFADHMTGSITLLVTVLCTGLYILYLLNALSNGKLKKTEKLKNTAKDVTGKETKQFFDSRWVTQKELHTDKVFMFNTWQTLKNSKDGVLIRSEMVNKSTLEINMFKPQHTLIIGTTGTGKTQKYILPTMQVLSSTKTKPSFVVSDPKGELYRLCKHKLETEGYDVKVFNLREPYASAKWNPLSNVYDMFHKAHHMQEGVKVHVGVNPADLGLRTIAKEYNYEWYEYEGIAYPNKQMLDSDLNSKKAELIDRSENELKEIAAALCPIEQTGSKDTSWERGAQEFLHGTLLAMLEDTLDEELGMTKDRFNFYNLAKICNFKDIDVPDKPYETLKKYLSGRDKFSKVPMLTSTAINNAPTTTKNFMGIVSSHLSLFNDNGMCFATSASEIDFDHFGDRPTALFIIIPDEKESRHPIATMMISQLYQKLVDLASRYPEEKLPRTVYFLLDEFANLPKIEKIGSMITVSRSRNIFFSLVIQSFSQFNSKYGDDVADTIKGNCPIKIFLGTDDAKTCEEFSKLCGDITLETTSTSESSQKNPETKKDEKQKSISTSTTSRPLIYPNELTLIGEADGTGEMIVKILNEFPIRTKSDPYWKTPMFDHTPSTSEYVISRSLDEEAISYSIVERNKKVFKPQFSAPNGARPRDFF